MATLATTLPTRSRDEELPHKIRVTMAMAAAVVLVVGLGWYGWDYYMLGLEQRVEHSLHRVLRPSGTVGLKLGMFGVALFMVIFVYPLRKRWRWLGAMGKTKHWLDFHSIVGVTAPIVITYHAAFKAGGLAGWAYWVMIGAALSGFVGRYIYTMIPRSLHATDCRYTFCGHAHEPKLFHVSSTGKAGDFIPTPGVAIPVPPHRQWLVIPGSAGQPRDGNPAACYAMLDEEQALLTFHRVPYDHESAGAKILAAKLPQRLASRLEQGQ